jgi:hypothetical protein
MPYTLLAVTFNIGTFCTVTGACILWPAAVPWSISFWLGWVASGLSLWLIRRSKESPDPGQ